MKAKKIIALVICIAASFMLAMSGIMKLIGGKQVEEGFAAFGISAYRIPLGLMELAFVALFLFPKTKRIGLLFITGYLGGAIATHLTHQMNLFGPTMPLVIFWIGAYLTDSTIFIKDSNAAENK